MFASCPVRNPTRLEKRERARLRALPDSCSKCTNGYFFLPPSRAETRPAGRRAVSTGPSPPAFTSSLTAASVALDSYGLEKKSSAGGLGVGRLGVLLRAPR